MNIEQQQLLVKAQESLQAAKILLDNNLAAFATAEEAKIIINKAEDMLKFSQNNIDLV